VEKAAGNVSMNSTKTAQSTVCTLYEGNYHYGVGALTNSLYRHGFRGDIWVGYRGPLPPWAHPIERSNNAASYRVAEGLVLRFIPLDTRIFLSNYKPSFALRVLDQLSVDSTALFYFDPDIVIKCDWSFYDAWAARGFACCEDNCYAHLPETHPLRWAWLDFAALHALEPKRILGAYYNGGFFGVSRKERGILEIWRELLELLESDGHVDLALPFKRGSGRHEAFFIPDQDTLNLALMVTTNPISAIGPEGMDFLPAGFTMSHAAQSPKPWRKKYLWHTLRRGVRVSVADTEYWRHTSNPIRLYRPTETLLHTLDWMTAKIIGRIVA
jgi:hypothetical protein